MNYRSLTVLFLLILSPLLLDARIPVYQAEVQTGYMQDWLICGPFETGQDGLVQRVLQSESVTKPVEEGGVEETPYGAQKWFFHSSDEPSILLHPTFGRKENAVFFAYAEIGADDEGVYTLAFGSNDSSRVWLNGEEVWSFHDQRGLKLDQDIFPVRLQKGVNRLLIKVFNYGASWGFSCKLLPFEAERYQNVRVLQVQSNGNSAQVKLHDPAGIAGRLFKTVEYRIVDFQDPAEIVRQGKWQPGETLDETFAVDQYRKYRLLVNREYGNGEKDSYSQIITLGEVRRYTLFDNGETAYRIIVSNNASESEQWAAQELQHWLEEISGARFSIADDSIPVGENEIVVGFNRHTSQILHNGVEAPAFSDEGFVVENAGPHILIYGGSERGTMYGVFDFLERELGCRWYSPGATVIPKRSTYEFLGIDRKDKPGIRVRNVFYYEAFDPVWAARNRVNGAMTHREQPGGVEAYWSVHTFFPLVPPDRYFKDHPEYFSLIEGTRQYDRAQLCLTNKDVLRIVIDGIKDVMRSNQQYLIYSVSQNDWYGACECEHCQKIVEEEGGESGMMLRFVNQVADAVKKEFPDKYIGTLAYQYTRKPPKHERPRDNVVIRLCSIECDFAHSFYDSPHNAEFLDDLQSWAKIAPKLYIWDYVVNFRHYIMPFPNFNALQENIQAFRDNNTIGIMEQGCYNTRGGEFAELKAYVLAKLLWNPDRNDVDEVINDFMYGYYGRGGQFVRQYFDLLHSTLTPDTSLFIFDHYDHRYYTDELIRNSEELFDRAEAVAENEAIRRRIQISRLPVMYLKLRRDLKRAIADGTVERFKKICDEEGIDRFNEQNPLAVLWQELDNAANGIQSR